MSATNKMQLESHLICIFKVVCCGKSLWSDTEVYRWQPLTVLKEIPNWSEGDFNVMSSHQGEKTNTLWITLNS